MPTKKPIEVRETIKDRVKENSVDDLKILESSTIASQDYDGGKRYLKIFTVLDPDTGALYLVALNIRDPKKLGGSDSAAVCARAAEKITARGWVAKMIQEAENRS